MTLTELRYIVALASEKHFGRAAEACFVSQPTLSVAVKKLEESRWASEWPYFRWLHDQLPEPFFQTQGFVMFFVLVAATPEA